MNSCEFGSKNDCGNRVDIFRGTANLCVKDNFFRHFIFFKKMLHGLCYNIYMKDSNSGEL